MLRIVVLISGNGSNLQAIIDTINKEHMDAQVEGVISNNPDAYGLIRATNAGIETVVVDHREHTKRENYDAALQQAIDHFKPDLIVLAGFMRILTDKFVLHYLGRMINIHPSLLPKYQGLNTHQRTLDAGDTEHGASVHFVTPKLDSGPIILQAQVPIHPNDSTETLAQRVHEQEHIIYPRVIKWFAEGRIKMQDHQAYVDGKLAEY